MAFRFCESSMCTPFLCASIFQVKGSAYTLRRPLFFVLDPDLIRRKEAEMNCIRAPPRVEFFAYQEFDLTEEIKMKYNFKKVFVKENGEYKSLDYKKFCCIEESDESYARKKFIPMHGYLLEVDENTYSEFYKEHERNRYLYQIDRENAIYQKEASLNNNGVLLGVNLVDDEFENRMIDRVMIDKLLSTLELLSADEQQLIDLIYFRGMSQRQASKIMKTPQSTLEYRISQLLHKIKILMQK